MSKALLTVALQYEQDVVVARQRARQISGLLGFDGQDQTRIATAVSEIARNAYRYAGGGKVERQGGEELHDQWRKQQDGGRDGDDAYGHRQPRPRWKQEARQQPHCDE